MNFGFLNKLLIPILFSVFFVAGISPATVFSATGAPNIFSYQGRLTNSDGILLGGAGTNYYFRFSLWDNSTVGAGSRLWPTATPGTTMLNVVDGVFNVGIGDTANGYPDALTYNFQDNSQTYLQVEVSTDGVTFETLNPRQAVNSAGFAINSNTLAGLVPGVGANNLLKLGSTGEINIAGTITALNVSGTNTGDITLSNAVGLSLTNQVLSVDALHTIPLIASTTAWQTAYSWGDHSTAGYLTDVATTTVQGMFSSGVGLSYSAGTFANTGVLSIGGLTGAVATSSLGLLTTDIIEGSNLYYTDARARGAFSSSVVGLTYTNSTGDFSLTSGYDIPLSASTTDWQTAYSWGNHAAAGYIQNISTFTTDNLTQGSSNLYFSNTLADARIASATSTIQNMFANGTGLSYSAGVFANTGVLSIGGLTGDVSTSSLGITSSQWTTSGADVYYNSGKVGIGTITPSQQLDVVLNSNSTTPLGFHVQNTNTLGATGFVLDNNNASATLTAQSYGATYPNAYYAGNSSIGARTNLILSSDTFVANGGTNSIKFLTGGYTGSTQERMIIDSSGKIGIGTTAPTSLLSEKSALALESGVLGPELLNSGGWTSAGWTGTDPFTHTVGNTTALSNTRAAVTAVLYHITYTITGRTAGTVAIAFGGQSINVSATGAWGPRASSGGTFVATPSTTFDGTVTFSVKAVTPYGSIFDIQDNTGVANFEIRSSLASLNNTFVGKSAGSSNTSGVSNTAVGVSALEFNTTGAQNTALGQLSLRNNTVGVSNMAFGYRALFNNTTGSYNSGIGLQSLFYNTTGSNNTGNGSQSLQNNSVGSGNTGIGAVALVNNTTGSNNVAIGTSAGFYQADGTTNLTVANNSIYIGAETRGFNNSDNNSIVIGYRAIGLGANSVVLGSSTITRTILQGNVGIGSTTPAYKLTVSGTVGMSGLSTDATVGLAGALCLDANDQLVKMSGSGTCVTSSERYKTDIVALDHGLDWVKSLRPVTFNYKSNGAPSLGLIAEEVDKISPLLTARNDDGQLNTVRYELLPAVIIKAIQELNAKVDAIGTSTISTSTQSIMGASMVDGLLGWVGHKITAVYGYFTEITADKVKVKKGIEMTDQDTGDVYCVVVKSGEFVKTKGECQAPVVIKDKSNDTSGDVGESIADVNGGENISTTTVSGGETGGDVVSDVVASTTESVASTTELVTEPVAETPAPAPEQTVPEIIPEPAPAEPVAPTVQEPVTETPAEPSVPETPAQ